MSMVMSPEELSFLYAMKGGRPKQGTEGGYDWSALASFGEQIDSTATTRMSGRLMRGHVQFVGVISVHPGQM